MVWPFGKRNRTGRSRKLRKTVREYHPDSQSYNVTAKSFRDGRIKSFLNFISDKVKPKSEELQDYTLNRKDFWRLERQAVKDPLLFSNVALYQACVCELMQLDRFHFEKQKTFEKFKRNLWPPEKTNFQNAFFSMAPMHLGIYGNCLTEVLYEKQDRKKAKAVDFITMDIREYQMVGATTSMIKTVRGMPWGFESRRDRETTFEQDKDVIWSRINQLHNLEWGWGWVELLFRIIDQIDAVQDARTQKNFRQGYPIPIVTYGNDRNPSSNSKKKEAKKIAKQFVDPDSVAYMKPDYMSVDFVDNKLPSNVSQQMAMDELHMRKIQAATLGIPVAVYLMSMEGQPSAGLEGLTEFFELRLKKFAKDLRIEKAVDLWMGGNSKEHFYIDYEHILAATKKEKIMQIFRVAKSDVLMGNNEEENKNIRQAILKMVGIDSEVDFIDKVEAANEMMRKIDSLEEVV